MQPLFIRVAENYQGLPHQQQALRFLSEVISEESSTAQSFLHIWRGLAKPETDALEAINPLLQAWESFSETAYLSDPGDPNSWTYGYGFEWHTVGGQTRRVRQGDTISRATANAKLEKTIAKIDRTLRDTIPHYDAFPVEWQMAMLSFAFNVGEYFYDRQGFATITRVLKDQEYKDVPEALMLYVNPGTAVEEGLRNRRQKEIDLWNEGLKTFNQDEMWGD